MKILIVCRYKEAFEPLHIMPFVVEQGEALRSQNNKVDYFTIQGNGLTAYIKEVSRLRHTIRQLQPDIVHAHFGLSGITTILAFKHISPSKCPKSIITFHNGETHNWYVNLLSSFASIFANHTIYVAQHIRDLCYFKAKHYSIIPCGVELNDLPITPYNDARRQLGFLPNKKYILFGGAFSNKRKNITLLREALTLLHRDDIEVLEMRGLNRQECAIRMCACDLFALPTHNEGSPQALKEAMACNCPIVATDVADIAHLLGQIEGHYLLRNPKSSSSHWEADEHSATELAALIEQALAHSTRTQGRQRIQELQLDNPMIAQRLIAIYRAV